MEDRRSNSSEDERKHTQWEGLFVSQHAWDSGDVSDPQPMLSAEEQQAIRDMLIVALDRQCTVFIQSWEDRHFKFHRCTIREIDDTQRIVTYEDPFGEWQLAIDTITSIHMLD
ncbi:YolD-like family protein [Planomicrobium okeanokoites]|uniref:YolD-like family protein n=1 Tax=Planomicrobium okeanokoites TaxID=244 RepID=UPI0024907517|nr:YolD-like family protein [Planomicrobium okeanokoites]